MEELIDTLKAILYLPPVRGDGVGITGVSGGQSVAIADTFAEAGLKVPLLTRESYDELATFYTLIGGGCRNPIDTANQNRREIKRIMEILVRDANIDNLVILTGARFGPGGSADSLIDLLINMRQKTPKPVMAILSWSFSSEDVKQAGDVIKKLQDGGVATFTSLARGALALRKALDYYNLKNNS
jgi:acyl-CoA synthetase (NDP forming)